MADDEGLLAVVTSANVACGFHAGDPSIMHRVCARAAALGVVVGAHVSYRDLIGFGRRAMAMAPDDLADDLAYQIGGLGAVARAAGAPLRYVKAHGALYNQASDDEITARVVARAVAAVDIRLGVLCLPGSAMATAADAAGLRVIGEGYLDRAYDERGRLVARSLPGAVITDPDEVVARAVALATAGSVRSVSGNDVAVDVQSLCTHGDTPAALDLARAARRALVAAGVSLRPFIDDGGE